MPGFFRRFFKKKEKPKLTKPQPRGKAPRGTAGKPPAKETPEQAAERQSASGEFTRIGPAKVKRPYAVRPGEVPSAVGEIKDIVRSGAVVNTEKKKPEQKK